MNGLRLGLCALWLAGASRAADASFDLYWGDVHGHTAFSDGRGTLDEYFTWARDAAGLDFVIVTDHDFGHAAPWRMPASHWTLTQDKADAYTVPGRFVAVAGYEWTSQPKYWTGWTNQETRTEGLFAGSPRFYNHKNVYFPGRVDYLFSAKDAAYLSPDRLADAVRAHGGLIHNNHPEAAPQGWEQFDYVASNATVIVNTEMYPDVIRFQGTNYPMHGEQTIRAFLARGGRTGFVGGTDTHEGRPAARTAVLALTLTRPAIFDALRHRRNYAITHARIRLDFRIEGQPMGAEVEVDRAPQIVVDVQGTAPLIDVTIVRDGVAWLTRRSQSSTLRFQHTDRTFGDASYYYLRVEQADRDPEGNPSRAWSSPIWVRRASTVAP